MLLVGISIPCVVYRLRAHLRETLARGSEVDARLGFFVKPSMYSEVGPLFVWKLMLVLLLDAW